MTAAWWQIFVTMLLIGWKPAHPNNAAGCSTLLAVALDSDFRPLSRHTAIDAGRMQAIFSLHLM
jgi:hypothetical protein